MLPVRGPEILVELRREQSPPSVKHGARFVGVRWAPFVGVRWASHSLLLTRRMQIGRIADARLVRGRAGRGTHPPSLRRPTPDPPSSGGPGRFCIWDNGRSIGVYSGRLRPMGSMFSNR